MDLQSATTTNNVKSPFDSPPPEILEQIFGYLKLPDVLNCRLVNKTWSKECSARLRIQLHLKNISQFLQYFMKTKKIPFIVKYFVNIESYEVMVNLFQCVDLLIKWFGPKCIPKLSIQITQGFRVVDWENLCSLITQISPGLQSLVIKEPIKVCEMNSNSRYVSSCDWSKIFSIFPSFASTIRNLYIYEPEGTKFTSFDTIIPPPGVTFPKLTSLAVGLHSAPGLIQQILQNSSKLVHLALLSLSKEEIGSSKYINFSTFFNKCYEYGFSLSQIENLETGLDLAVTYEALAKLKFPNLKTLKLHIMNKIEGGRGEVSAQQNLLKAFIESKCPALMSLEFVFHCQIEEYQLLACLPILPNLTDLKLNVGDECKGIFNVDIEQYTGLSSKFPNLNYMSLQLGIIFYRNIQLDTGIIMVEQSLEYLNLHLASFESVETLELTTNQTCSYYYNIRGGGNLSPMNHNIQQLRVLFPNVNHLIINNQPDCEVFKERLIKEIFHVFNGVEKLTFKEYYFDWIPQVLCGTNSTQMLDNFKSLKCIRIPAIHFNLRSSCLNKDGLEILLKHLPNLELLEIAPSSKHTDPALDNLIGIEALKKLYPSVRIEYI